MKPPLDMARRFRHDPRLPSHLSRLEFNQYCLEHQVTAFGADYPVCLEIEGKLALFTNPESGDMPRSYPVPTLPALKGIFEAIHRSEWAGIQPYLVHICRPVGWTTISTNYGGPLRKDKNIKEGTNFQQHMTVLTDVIYRIFARPVNRAENFRSQTTNGEHAWQDMFQRKLKKGRLYEMPSLGLRNFTADYFGPFRKADSRGQAIAPVSGLDLDLPSLLIQTLSPDGRFDPRFGQDISVRGGILDYRVSLSKLELHLKSPDAKGRQTA